MCILFFTSPRRKVGEGIDSTKKKALKSVHEAVAQATKDIYEVPDSDDSEGEIVRIGSSDISALAPAIPDRNIQTSKTRSQASTRKSSRTPSKRKFDNYMADENLWMNTVNGDLKSMAESLDAIEDNMREGWQHQLRELKNLRKKIAEARRYIEDCGAREERFACQLK
ncbi:hypothetical protein B0O99DRAFT_158897 [Bisporella sp. PMI_857]|nr:hypothetical protein B0O99DRAFT_158897 [Bisporella sp. PMI_857]